MRLLPETLLLLLLCLLSYAGLVPAPHVAQITPAPKVPRQLINDPDFIGWLTTSVGARWEYWTCEGDQFWYTSGDYGQCCPTTSKSCTAVTACLNGSSLVYEGTGANLTVPCTTFGPSYAKCITDFVYQYWGGQNPASWIGCAMREWQYTFYRDKPANTVVTTTTASTSSDGPATVTVGPSTASRPVAAATTTSSGGGSSSSKAWIAGAVIGPIAAIALAGIGFWIYRRKTANKPSDQQTVAPRPSEGPPHAGPPPAGMDPNAYPVWHPTSPSPQPPQSPPPMSDTRTSQYTQPGSPEQQWQQHQQWQQQQQQQPYQEQQPYQQGWSQQYGQPWPPQEGPKPEMAPTSLGEGQIVGQTVELPAMQERKYR